MYRMFAFKPLMRFLATEPSLTSYLQCLLYICKTLT